MKLNSYGELLRSIILKHGVLAPLAYQIALDLQERKWVPYSEIGGPGERQPDPA